MDFALHRAVRNTLGSASVSCPCTMYEPVRRLLRCLKHLTICVVEPATQQFFSKPSYLHLGLLPPQSSLSAIHRHHHKELNMSRTPNDDRSDSMNPNNDAYEHSQDNRSDQLNPNNDEYQGNDGNDNQ